MNPAADALYAAAEELLAASALALEDSHEGPPDYQAIVQGLPVFDCPPALYVSVGVGSVASTLPPGPTMQELQRIVSTGNVNLITFTVTIIRCVSVIGERGPNGLLPSAADVSLDARICYSDLWAIWNGLVGQHRAGTLFQNPSGRREFAVDSSIPVRTQGGAGGWLIPCRVQLGGYCPEPPS